MNQKQDINCVGKYFLTFVFIMIFLTSMMAQNSYKQPDFAFPQEVEKESDSLLKSSLEKGDGLLALRAMMNLCIARNELLNSQSVQSNLNLIDSVTSQLTGEYRRLVYLIKAVVLKEDYNWNKFVYDERILPLNVPYPSDPSEWSGEMFKTKILELVSEATENLDSLDEINISSIEVLLSDYQDAERMHFTVGDFIRFNAVNILEEFATPAGNSIIPFYPVKAAESIEGKANETARNLLEKIIITNFEKNSPVAAMAISRMIDFLPQDERESYLKSEIIKLNGKEGKALVVFKLWQNFPPSDESQKKEIYGLITDTLQEFPSDDASALLKYAKESMEEKRINLSLPSVVLPNEPVNFKANLNNLNKAYILIFRLNENQYDKFDNLILKKFTETNLPVEVLELSSEGEIPFETEAEVNSNGLPSGMYVAVPSISKKLSKGWNKIGYRAGYSTFRVSDISILTINDRGLKDSGKIYVVSSKDQKPIAGAKVSIFNGSSSKPVKVMTTDLDGSVFVSSSYYRIEARYNENVAKSDAWFSYNEYKEPDSKHISILTDLSIYRPGDEMEFVIVGWQQDKEGNSLVKNKGIEITLHDANFTKIKSVNITLDEQGRATGKFTIPEGGLLGTYHLSAAFDDKPEISYGMANVEIADYKLPPFEVKVNQENSDILSELNFKGVAQTYSGMPIPDAEVRITIDFSRWEWGWIRSHENASFHTTTRTSKNGEFQLQLPTGGLRNTIFEKGVYTLKAEVTSSSGERVSSLPLYFYLGKAYSIRPEIPEKVEIKGENIDLHVPVYDMAGLPEKVKTCYRLVDFDNPKDTIEGTFISPTLKIESKQVKSGRYKIEFKPDGEGQWVSTETIFWRNSENSVPFKTSLWIPRDEYVFTPEQKDITVNFGSYWKDWILCVISNENSLIEQKWISPEDGMTELKIILPDSSSTYFIQLAGMHDLKTQNGVITIIPAKRKEKMSIETLSFRENLSAGTSERWSFRFSIDDIGAPGVNVLAVMSDKALNALMNFKWNLGIWTQGVYSKVNMGIPIYRLNHTTGFYSPSIMYPKYKFYVPAWDIYGFSWIYYKYNHYNNNLYYKRAATRNLKGDFYEEEDAMEMPMAVESVKTTSGFAAINDSMTELSMEEGAGAGGESNIENQELRPIELPLAFFKPNLKGDENGVVNIDFKVPDFNTTWQLQLAGYNEDLLNASVILDAVASKIVMTKSNLPQFLRTGDKAEVSALLFNNSSDTILIKGKIIVLNPENEEVIEERIYEEETVDPSGNRIISLQFDVPDNLNLLAIRCYGISGDNSDGEQGFIPVYPSSTPVIDSKTFYVGSQSEKIEIKLPKFKKDSNVTLKYCDNPLWEVLLALPALDESPDGSVLSVIKSLYAVMMANNIVQTNGEISSCLEKLFSSENSSLPLSNLQKDESLKSVSLLCTPWVNNAENETQRIRSLKNYLDEEKVNNRIDQLKATLKKLQNSDGGWSWFEGFKSSPFITSEVIFVLSYLDQVNLLDKELRAMAFKGIDYYDKYLLKLRKEKTDLALATTLHYIYSRGLIDNNWKGGMKEIKKETLEKARKEWRYGSMAMKTVTALVYLREVDYRDEGKLIIKSLKEFLNIQHPLFEEAWALILFNQEDPQGEATERLRELLYLQKETEDWGKNSYTAGIIHALVLTTPDTIYNRTRPEIYLGGKKIEIPSQQEMTGNYTIDLDIKEVSGKSLIINREPGIPAWGGVISQYIEPIKDVKSAVVVDLKIEKHIYIRTSDGKSKEVAQLKKGDKIQVVINIDCKKEMDYVAVVDQLAASLQSDEQLSGMVFIDGLPAYQEVRDNTVSFFFEKLSAGKYVISYDCQVEREGEYALGIVSAQSLYSPSQTAHSSGSLIKVNF